MTLQERLREWAQNNEMIYQWYTEHGKDCNRAAKLIDEYMDLILHDKIRE